MLCVVPTQPGASWILCSACVRSSEVQNLLKFFRRPRPFGTRLCAVYVVVLCKFENGGDLDQFHSRVFTTVNGILMGALLPQ